MDFSRRTLLKPQREEEPPYLGPTQWGGECCKEIKIKPCSGEVPAFSGRIFYILNKKREK